MNKFLIGFLLQIKLTGKIHWDILKNGKEMYVYNKKVSEGLLFHRKEAVFIVHEL